MFTKCKSDVATHTHTHTHTHTLHLQTLQWVSIRLGIKPKSLPQPRCPKVIWPQFLPLFVSFSLRSGHRASELLPRGSAVSLWLEWTPSSSFRSHIKSQPQTTLSTAGPTPEPWYPILHLVNTVLFIIILNTVYYLLFLHKRREPGLLVSAESPEYGTALSITGQRQNLRTDKPLTSPRWA